MHNLSLVGISSTGGGEYNNVMIEGVGKIKGDISCNEIRVDGIVTAKGSVKCTSMNVKGTCTVDGSINGQFVRLEGLMTVHGGLEAEDFYINGSFKMDEVLNADSIQINFAYGAYVKEVYGEKISIKKLSAEAFGFAIDLIPWRHKGKMFNTSCVEGDDIYLEHVEADTVRGQHVNIGPECRIGRLEYHDTVTVHPSAQVTEMCKIDEESEVDYEHK